MGRVKALCKKRSEDVNKISDWREECEAMQVQALGDMTPEARAVFIVAVAAHREAMRATWPAEHAEEAARLRDEFSWLYTAAVTLQQNDEKSCCVEANGC
jgi:hypothetical protein